MNSKNKPNKFKYSKKALFRAYLTNFKKRSYKVILKKFFWRQMDSSQNNGTFSFKRGGKQIKGQANQANIFAMAAATS